ncbi:TPA: hypothetical protein HA243_06420 [Candidatus Micrarchaeota archaeon]|nr:hypothetical protein [Candidatus Micrarchaeota archaeon]
MLTGQKPSMPFRSEAYAELDKEWKSTCRECSDSWFCHNVEGMQNALFCFNTKSKRYAVGNAEVGKEQFGRAKRMVQDYVLQSLEEKKSVPLSVFNVACKDRI